MGALCGKHTNKVQVENQSNKTNQAQPLIVGDEKPQRVQSIVMGDPNETDAQFQKMKTLKEDNPFLHAMLFLTQGKTEMMEHYDENAEQIQGVSIEILDYKKYNEYNTNLDFNGLILSISKKLINWVEFKSKMGDCRKEPWLMAVTKYAYKFQGRTNFVLRFGQDYAIDVESKNIWDAEIEEAIKSINKTDRVQEECIDCNLYKKKDQEGTGDKSKLVWTVEFERNMLMMFYHNEDSEIFDNNLILEKQIDT